MTENFLNDEILIVDDQQPMRMLLTGLLRSLKFVNIRQAASGSRALTMIKEQRPDMIFLDLEMPDMHGLAVLEQVREMEDSDAMFVVIQTGSATKDNVERALELKVDDLLAKPYSREKLEVAIRRYRQRRG
ncbi:MAG: response regulator [Wenzhouxiangella sp.]|jgi:CheY-like chemotaxis protein|nr:response regulator [Wenzhouxiangella sp.]